MKFYLLLVFLFINFVAYSQNENDIEISSENTDTSDIIFDYNSNQVSNLNQEPTHNSAKVYYNSPYLSKGWRLFCEVGAQKAFDKYTCSVLDFSFSIGWQINHYFYAGIGIGEQAYLDHWYYGVYSDESTMALVLPLFLDVRVDFLDKKISPFFDFRFGYSATDDEYNNYSGMYFNTSIGVRFWKFNFSFGPEIVKLDSPWYVREIKQSGLEVLDINYQGSYMFKLSYELGGNF